MKYLEDSSDQEGIALDQGKNPDGQIALEIKGTTEEINTATQRGLLARVDFAEKLKELPIKLAPADIRLNLKNLRSDDVAPSGSVLVCDFPVSDEQENGMVTLPGIDKYPEAQFKWGYRKNDGIGEILNIDHHFRREDFYRAVSSTNLAIEYVKEHGPVGKDYTVVITHKDCDSILSSLIMRGILPPKEEFGEAAIAADHTGMPNDIADLLQGCEHGDNIEFSLRNLQRLLNGEELEPKAKELLGKRLSKREKVSELASKAKYTLSGKIAYIETDEATEGSFFPALLPEAELIVIVCARSQKDEHDKPLPGKQAKVMLGMKARSGTNVVDIVKPCDPNFGGRWNAGSDDRWGGFTLSMGIEEYVKLLEKHLGLPIRVDFAEKLKELPIKLIPKGFKLNLESLRSDEVASHGNVLVCDMAIIDKQEQGTTLPGIDRDPKAQFIKWGYRTNDDEGDILNIDHHFRTKDFYRAVSSTNLAIEYVKQYGTVGEDYTVIINHTDCDSVLSSAIMRGILLPLEDKFGVAAIAADHTGMANDIADLLQACESEEDIEFSLRNLQRLLEGKELEPKAKGLLEKRLKEREIAVGLANKAKYSSSGRIASIDTGGEATDGVFFPALLPEAEFIVIVCPRSGKDKSGNPKQAKVRLGMKAKVGTNVANIVKPFDPEFGGRWNAGSNDNLKGFTFSSIEEYVGLLEEALLST